MSKKTEPTEMIELIKLAGCNSRIERLKPIEQCTKLIEEVIEDAHAIEMVIDCA